MLTDQIRTDQIRGRSPNSTARAAFGVRGPCPSELGLRPRIPLVAALALVGQILFLKLAPYPLAEPFATLWYFLAYASLTLFLWIATHGRRPLAVPAGVIVLGVLDLPVAAAAACAVAATLFVLQGRPVCAESSPR